MTQATTSQPSVRRRYHRDDRRATPEEMAALLAEYQAAEAKRQEREFRYVCPCCVHQPVEARCAHGTA
jgi:hypothetical protein